MSSTTETITSKVPAGGGSGSPETATRDLGRRVVGLTGAASVIAAFTGLSIAETDSLGVDPRTPPSFIFDVYVAHTGQMRAGAILCAVAAVLAMVFCGALWVNLKAAGEWQAMVAVAGAFAMGLAWLAAAAEQVAFLTFAEYENGMATHMLLMAERDQWAYITVPFLVLAIAGALASLPTWFRAVSAVVVAIESVTLVPGNDVWAPAMIGFAYGIAISLFVTLSAGKVE